MINYGQNNIKFYAKQYNIIYIGDIFCNVLFVYIKVQKLHFCDLTVL